MKFTPHGIVIPIVTPVDQNGELNEAAYRKLLRHFVNSGVHGVFPFGTTGEYYAFDDGFFRHMLEITVDEVKGCMDVYAGANHITPKGAIALAKIAQETGADALSVLTPLFVSQTQKEVEAYYRTVADATDLPIIIYNNRPKTNVTVEPTTARSLAAIENIVAIKDSTGDMTNTEEYLRLTRDIPGFSVMMGRDTLIYAALCYGAVGAISSCANVAPKLTVSIYENYMAGNMKEALEAQFKLSELRIATNIGTFPVVIKEALAMIGYNVGECVPPILPLDDHQRKALHEVLKSIGLL